MQIGFLQFLTKQKVLINLLSLNIFIFVLLSKIVLGEVGPNMPIHSISRAIARCSGPESTPINKSEARRVFKNCFELLVLLPNVNFLVLTFGIMLFFGNASMIFTSLNFSFNCSSSKFVSSSDKFLVISVDIGAISICLIFVKDGFIISLLI